VKQIQFWLISARMTVYFTSEEEEDNTKAIQVHKTVPADTFTRFTTKGLQSRSATSLLIKRNWFMEQKTKLIIVLTSESYHIVGSCWGKQRCMLLLTYLSDKFAMPLNHQRSHKQFIAFIDKLYSRRKAQ
jgi:hypothetical protein